MQNQGSSKFLLPVIVFSQFAGTSLWFAGNAIINEILPTSSASFANITSVVQFGFIAGTLVFSLFTIADRFIPSRVFFFSSLIASLANLLLILLAKEILWLYILRFVTGFFLAGIYPVGMKIASDCFPKRLGNALGFLVGALVLGTAFPHILKSKLNSFPWQDVLLFTSLLAILGGLLVLLSVPDNRKKKIRNNLNFNTAFTVFQSPNFRSAAFGYFGHMWELYAFWAFVPFIIMSFNETNNKSLNIPFWSFVIIAAGSFGCITGGLISRIWGSKKVAFYSLLISCICCLISPLLFHLPVFVFLLLLSIWGITVAADSPQFSTLVAQSAPSDHKGTALTIVTSIGFAITIISIQLLKPSLFAFKEFGFVMLFIGPAIGLFSLRKLFDDS